MKTFLSVLFVSALLALPLAAQTYVTNQTVSVVTNTQVLLVTTVTNAVAGTNAPMVEFPPQVNTVLTFLTTASNLIAIPYGTYDTGSHSWGGGLALTYKATPLFMPVVRFDGLGNQFWMVSGGAELQVPIRVGGTNGVLLIPFGLACASTPVSGGGDDNGTLQSVEGLGLAVNINKHWNILADYEWWSARPGNQIRFGFGYQF